jgi:crossover junction endodeoxyribonuclease RusA
MTFTLPFPPNALSPNSRVHWSVLAKAKAKYKEHCGWEAVAQGLGKIEAETLNVAYTFYPPTRARHDADNLAARLKAATDALADVTGINDRHFTFAPVVIGGYVNPGHVRVDLTWETKE